MQQLDAKITFVQQQLQSKDYQMHQKGLQLQTKKKDLLAKKAELEEDTDQNLSPEEMREKLKMKVKDSNQEIEMAEKRIKQVDALVERYQDDIRAKENELAEAKKHAQKAKKYEAVYERDRKMQEFIDEFPQMGQKDKKDLSDLKFTIVALLKHISKGVSLAENL